MIKTLFLIGILFTLAAIAFKGPDQTAWEFALQTATKIEHTIGKFGEDRSDVAARNSSTGSTERSTDRLRVASEVAKPLAPFSTNNLKFGPRSQTPERK